MFLAKLSLEYANFGLETIQHVEICIEIKGRILISKTMDCEMVIC